MTDNEKLCVPCQSVVRIEQFGGGYPHHPNLHSLYGSAQDGCPLCAMVLESFSNFKDFPGLNSKDAKHSSVSFGLEDGRLDSSDEEDSSLDLEPYIWFRLGDGNPMKGAFDQINFHAVPVDSKSPHYI